MSDPPSGLVVTFYSFKGGVGRSMAMANVGEILADLGYRVIVCDWDLEAPGLERYFAEDPEKLGRMRRQPGILDLLVEYKRTMTRAGDSGAIDEDEDFFERVGGVLLRRPSSYAQPIRSAKQRQGTVRLLTAGRRGGEHESSYAEAVQRFDWTEFYEKWAGGSYIEFFRQEVSDRRVSDVVLTDSRTGVTEQGGVCTHHLADLVVLLTAANDLNLDGVKWMAEVLSSEDLAFMRAGRPLGLMPIAARIEQKSQRDELNEFRRRMLRELGAYVPRVLGDPKEFLFQTEIPYVPYYSFVERVAAREPPAERDEDLYRKYENLAEAIVAYGAENKLLEARAAARPEPPSVPRPDVDDICYQHVRWLESGGAEGRRADFTKAELSRADFTGEDLARAIFDRTNLRGANLAEANLQDASLRSADLANANLRSAELAAADLEHASLLGANLRDARLSRASLKHADLEGADLGGADLHAANLTRAKLVACQLGEADLSASNLQGANLESALDLAETQLALANLENARLPESLVPLESVRRARAILGAVRGIPHLTVFTALAAGGSFLLSDFQILKGHSFFWYLVLFAAAPVGFLLYSAPRLRVLSKLPRVMPDGSSVEAHVAGLFIRRLRLWERPDGRFAARPTLTPLLSLAPLALLTLGVRYLPFQNQVGLAVIASAAALAATTVVFLPRATSRSLGTRASGLRRTVPIQLALAWLVATVVVALAIFLGYRALGIKQRSEPSPGDQLVARQYPPRGSEALPRSALFLEGRDLRELDLHRTSLRDAWLKSANLAGQNLDAKDLTGANLAEANLEGASLRKAIFDWYTDLSGARLREADLTGAIFLGEWSPTLRGADLTDAKLASMDLRGVDLSEVIGLTEAQLLSARLDESTRLPDDVALPPHAMTE